MSLFSVTRRKFIVLAICIIYPNLSYSVTLDEALRLAYRNHPSIYSSLANLRSTDEQASRAFSGWLPKVSFGYERGPRETRSGGVDTDRQADTKDLTITQPIFDGGETLAEMSQAEKNIMAAQSEFLLTEQQVLRDAAIAYMDIVKDQRVLELNKNNISVLEQHLEATKERHSLGEVTKTDVAQAKANLAKANTEKKLAESDLAASRATYKKIVGEDPVNISMPDNYAKVDQLLPDLIDTGLSVHPSIKQAENLYESAKDSISIKKSSLLPTLNVTASTRRQKGVALTKAQDADTNSILFNLTVPLYQSGSEYSDIRQAKQDAEKLRYDLDLVKKTVRESITQSYHEYKVAISSVESDRVTVEAFETVLDGVSQEAKIGARTTLDVLDAEQDLFEAKSRLISSQRDVIVNSYKLLADAGILSAKTIGVDENIYDLDEYRKKVKYQIIGF
ncbi:TolC family outer membrane protein [Rickettsiales bacterium]|nr:TolC family outer membrane protein [Rickettsiales bacterium]